MASQVGAHRRNHSALLNIIHALIYITSYIYKQLYITRRERRRPRAMLESRLRERQPLSYLLSLLCLSRARAPARLIYIHTHTHTHSTLLLGARDFPPITRTREPSRHSICAGILLWHGCGVTPLYKDSREGYTYTGDSDDGIEGRLIWVIVPCRRAGARRTARACVRTARRTSCRSTCRYIS